MHLIVDINLSVVIVCILIIVYIFILNFVALYSRMINGFVKAKITTIKRAMPGGGY